MEELELYKRRLAQEMSARRQAEALIKQKSVELLYQAREREREQREAQERDHLLVQLSPDAILIESEDRIVFANPAALRLYRAKQPADLLGKTMQNLVAPAYRTDLDATISQVGHDGKTHAVRTVEEQALCVDGGVVDVAVTRLSFNYRGKPAVHMVARDISQRKSLETQLLHQATHDPLTGLPNRSLLVDRLHLAIAEAKRYRDCFVVAFIDLDRFKWINDSFGHDAGDALLKTVSTRMLACLRESDTIARLGGDEFVLVLRDSGNGDESMQVLNRVVACVSTPMTIGGHVISVTCSM